MSLCSGHSSSTETLENPEDYQFLDSEDDAKDHQGVWSTDDVILESQEARRPMNSFLLFCNRHRPIVREKFPNLQNRGVTKILGQWWRTLNTKLQRKFKVLAMEVKGAFHKAHPNFQWRRKQTVSVKSTESADQPLHYDSETTNRENVDERFSFFDENSTVTKDTFNLSNRSTFLKSKNYAHNDSLTNNSQENDILQETLSEAKQFFLNFDDDSSEENKSRFKNYINIRSTTQNELPKSEGRLTNNAKITNVTRNRLTQSAFDQFRYTRKTSRRKKGMIYQSLIENGVIGCKTSKKTNVKRCIDTPRNDSNTCYTKQKHRERYFSIENKNYDYLTEELQEKIKSLPLMDFEKYNANKKSVVRRPSKTSKKRTFKKVKSQSVKDDRNEIINEVQATKSELVSNNSCQQETYIKWDSILLVAEQERARLLQMEQLENS